LSVRLERYVYLTLVTLALCATILVASPAVAEAEEGAKAATHEEEEAAAQSAKRGADATHAAHAVVARPGDSLWSISEEHLGPNATLQQIDREVERIYALNRDRIGADPNLIFSGQELLVPSVGESSASSTPGSPAEGEATRRGQTTHTQERATEANKAGQAPEQAPAPAPERATLPELAAAQPVPTARSLTSGASLPEDGNAKRRLIGWVLLALSFGAACVLAFLAAREWWRRRAKRSIGELLGEEVYRTNYALFDPLSRDTEEASRSAPVPATAAIGQPSGASAGGTLTEGNLRAGGSTGTFAAARRKRRRRKSVRRRSGRARPLREGLATGAHNPNVRRRLRATPGDAPRKRRRAKEPRRSVITRELANASKARGAERTQGGR
jgi:LysM repeat protein